MPVCSLGRGIGSYGSLKTILNKRKENLLSSQSREDLHPGRHDPSKTTPSIPSGKERSFTSFILTFVISFGTWLVLSGKFDFLHISLGIVSCLIVAIISGELLVPPQRIRGIFVVWLRFIRYLPWMLYQIFLANIYMMYLVFHPRMMDLIDPRIIRFKSRLTHEMSLFIFANSITLTPGTITVYVTIHGDYTVHVIDKKSGQSLPGEMEKRVAKIIGE